MSIFSKIGSAVKSTYNKVKTGISNAVKSFSPTAGLVANVASAISSSKKSTDTSNVFGSPAYNAKSVAIGAQPASGPGSAYYGTGGSNVYTTSAGTKGNASSYSSVPGFIGPQLPVTISAGKQSTSTGGSTGIDYASSVQPQRTLTSTLLGGASTIGSSGSAVTAPISLPNNAPSSINPGTADNTKLASTLADYYTVGKDNTLTKVADTQNVAGVKTPQQIADEKVSLYERFMKKDNVEDPEVRQAMQRKQEIQQALSAPTAALNAVVAKQTQDLLTMKETGSSRGVTEDVFNRQAAQINYNAAIASLPLQASIASLQGDLKLAQDYLSELTTMKQEQINNQYEYGMNLMKSIESELTTQEKRQYDRITAEMDRQYKSEDELIKFQAELANRVFENAGGRDVSNIISRITNSKDMVSAVNAAGSYGVAPNTQIVQLDNGQTVVVDKTSGKIVSNIGGAKSPTTYDVTGLTPEQASDPFIQKMAASAGGKPITDAFAQKLNKGLTVLDQIGVLQINIKDVKTGPIVGAFKGANPWDTNAQTIKAQLNAIVPNLARGVFGEVGVLTDNDIAQYSKTLPNLKSTEDIRNAVLGITVDLIGKSIKQTLEVNAANQKDVSGFIDIYTNMQATRDSIFSQIPGYKGTQSSSNNVDYTKSLDALFQQ